MPGEGRVLLVDDDPGLLRTLQVLLEDEGGYTVVTAASGEGALAEQRGSGPFDVVVTDVSMPGMGGMALLRELRQLRPELPVLMMTAFGSVASAVEAMKLGAYQYLTKPIEPDELLMQLERALGESRQRRRHRQLRDRTGDPESFDELIGDSEVIEQVRRVVSQVAAVDSTVLIRGETGTGKELVARLIHARGARREQAFVTVNCTAIPGELLESELFGHEKGSFTGAMASRRGRIEEAEGGTLLLDEIGDMPLALQPKILRFLQERTARRVGGERERWLDVRIIAATHRDLEQAMVEGEFREDLFYRLAAVPLELPPLRAHPEDLAVLCRHLLRKIARRIGRSVPVLGEGALAALSRYSFPGNVRELENLLERAIVLGRGKRAEELMLADLPSSVTGVPEARSASLPLEGGFERLAVLHEEIERDLIERALRAWPDSSNNEIARRLGTNRRVLELRMKSFGLSKKGNIPGGAP